MTNADLPSRQARTNTNCEYTISIVTLQLSHTTYNDEQNKYYQMQINNDEQTGSIT